MKSWKPEAIILAIGMLIMGYFIKNGLDTFAGKDRVVTAKDWLKWKCLPTRLLGL